MRLLDEERRKVAADAGDFAAYYQLDCKGGDFYACNAFYTSTKSFVGYREAKLNSSWSGIVGTPAVGARLTNSIYEMDHLEKATSLSYFTSKKTI